MPFDIYRGSLDSNNRTSFEFSDTVYQYVVGIQTVKLAFSLDNSDDNKVMKFALHLDTNLEGNTVNVTGTPVLYDDEGHNYEVESIELCCLAVIGSNDLSASLQRAPGSIGSNQSSTALSIPPNTDLLLGMLSGFDFDYGSDDHYVRTISASVSADATASGAVLSGTAQMFDNSGNTATSSIDASMIAYSGVASSGLLVRTVTYQEVMANKVVDFGQPIQRAMAFLQSWTVTYDGSKDHKLAEFRAGVEISLDEASGKVTLENPSVLLEDNDDNSQNNNASNVTLVVIATTP